MRYINLRLTYLLTYLLIPYILDVLLFVCYLHTLFQNVIFGTRVRSLWIKVINFLFGINLHKLFNCSTSRRWLQQLWWLASALIRVRTRGCNWLNLHSCCNHCMLHRAIVATVSAIVATIVCGDNRALRSPRKARPAGHAVQCGASAPLRARVV